MSTRPQLAAKISQCIAEWSEVEVFLGAFLGALLHTNRKAAVAMYSGVENRASQLRLITCAAEATLAANHNDVISLLISAVIRPAMKERDKLAHWTWGYSEDLPDALLLCEPSNTLDNLMRAIVDQPGIENAAVPTNFDDIYVIRLPDLEGISTRLQDAKKHLRLAIATFWQHSTPKERASYLRQLSNVPQIREGLNRLARARQKNQASPAQERASEPNGKP